MPGINTGILANAQPLQAATVKELEKQVIENKKSFVYLDENSELCFAIPHGIDGLKDLAWHNAYELSATTDTLFRKVYVQTPNSFIIKATQQKQSYDEPWESFTDNSSDGESHNNLIPAGAFYGNFNTGDLYTEMPETVSLYDVYLYGDYFYTYGFESSQAGWVVGLATADSGILSAVPNYPAKNKSESSYGDILVSINNMAVIKISDGAFRGCTNLTSISIPHGVENIGSNAFYDCHSLTSIEIPASVIKIEGYAFEGSTNLKNITFMGTIEQWKAIEKEPGWNVGTSATEVTCSDGVTSFG